MNLIVFIHIIIKMTDKYNSTNMKKAVNNIENLRANIIGKKNISNNMQALKNTFN